MPPALILFDGNWPLYQRQLSEIFRRDISGRQIQFRGQNISCRRHPEEQGQWASFWHLVSEGYVEEERTPDLRRCERLSWVKWVIENADNDDTIDVWENRHKGERNYLLWYNEEYLVILAIRNGYFLLKTAYCTTQPGRIRRLRKQRDRAKND